MKKIISVLVASFITLCSFAQPSFYRAYSRAFGEVLEDGKVSWQEDEPCHTLFSVEEDKIVVYAKETTSIYITKDLTEDAGSSLVYEGVDSDGAECSVFVAKTEDGKSCMFITYAHAAVMFWFAKEE